MFAIRRAAPWPLTLKVPLLVAALVVAVAVVISQIVLSRLAQDQEANLRLLTNAYLDGISTAVLPAVGRADVWEAFDALDRARGQYAGVEARNTIVELSNGTILAASDPVRFPVQSAIPAGLQRHFPEADGLVIDSESGRAWVSRTLRQGDSAVGRILAEIDIADLLRIRHQVLLTLILVNGALAIAFALIGYFALKRMVQPLGVLTRYVESVRDGRVEAIPDQHGWRLSSEFRQLFDRFNSMARALNERETLASHLAEQERYAMLGKLASGMAHEVNNPLGGMLNAIDTIQAHGDDPAVLQKSLDFLKRGLAGIRNVVRAALVTYKGGGNTSVLTPGDLDDLPFLVQHETGGRHLTLDWRNRIAEPLAIEGAVVRQIALNLLLNACAASPLNGRVSAEAASDDLALTIVVADEGQGLPAELANMLEEPAEFVAPPEGVSGLGVWTCVRLVKRLGGSIRVLRPPVGTKIVVTIPYASEEGLHAVA